MLPLIVLLTTGCELIEETLDTASTEDTSPVITECETIPGEGCYWMENYDDLSCWVQAPQGDDTDYNTCRSLDSCQEGGGGESGGGCYKWSDGNEGAAANWMCDYYEGPEDGACYWMENEDNQWCWVPAPEGEVDVTECQALDSCHEFGGGESGGGCYKWSDNSFANGDPWAEASIVDNDNDGVGEDEDCDDNDPARFPGNAEICDGVDNDCDSVIPADELDADGDGEMTCEGDCDDDNDDTYSTADEICDGLDNDCDGSLGSDVLYELASDPVSPLAIGATANAPGTAGIVVTPDVDLDLASIEVYYAVDASSASSEVSVVLYEQTGTDTYTQLESQAITVGTTGDWYGASGLTWSLDAGTTYLIGITTKATGSIDYVTGAAAPPWGTFSGMYAHFTDFDAATITGTIGFPSDSIGFRFNSDC